MYGTRVLSGSTLGSRRPSASETAVTNRNESIRPEIDKAWNRADNKAKGQVTRQRYDASVDYRPNTNDTVPRIDLWSPFFRPLSVRVGRTVPPLLVRRPVLGVEELESEVPDLIPNSTQSLVRHAHTHQAENVNGFYEIFSHSVLAAVCYAVYSRYDADRFDDRFSLSRFFVFSVVSLLNTDGFDRDRSWNRG